MKKIPTLVTMEGENMNYENDVLEREPRIDDFAYQYDEYDLSGEDFEIIKGIARANGYDIDTPDDVELLGNRFGDWIRRIVSRIRSRRAARHARRAARRAARGSSGGYDEGSQVAQPGYPTQSQPWTVNSPYGTVTAGGGGFGYQRPGQMGLTPFAPPAGMMQQIQQNPMMLLMVGGVAILLITQMTKKK